MPPETNQQFPNSNPPILNQNKKDPKFILLVILGLILIATNVYFLYKTYFVKEIVIEEQNLVVDNTKNYSIVDFGQINMDQWKTYRNDQYGFEIKYPDHWGYRIENKTIQFDIEKFFDNPPCTACDRGRMLYIYITDLDSFLKEQEQKVTTFEEYINSNNFSWLEKPLEFVINDQKWLCAENEGIGMYQSCVSIKDRNVYFANLPFNDDRESLKPYLTEIVLSTFKFISTTTSAKLINSDTENVTDFKGYYFKKESYWYDESTPTLCDAFVIIDGEEFVINYFKNMVHAGNTINSINSKGNLIVSIDFSEVENTIKNKILASTEDKPISLTLKKKVQVGKGAPMCSSFFKIIKVN